MLLVACTSPTAPPNYEEWFEELEACSGLRGYFDRIRFLFMDEVVVNGKQYGGYWWNNDTIWLRNDLAQNELMVKHELMHSLVRTLDHPVQYFNGVCGDLNG